MLVNNTIFNNTQITNSQNLTWQGVNTYIEKMMIWVAENIPSTDPRFKEMRSELNKLRGEIVGVTDQKKLAAAIAKAKEITGQKPLTPEQQKAYEDQNEAKKILTQINNQIDKLQSQIAQLDEELSKLEKQLSNNPKDQQELKKIEGLISKLEQKLSQLEKYKTKVASIEKNIESETSKITGKNPSEDRKILSKIENDLNSLKTDKKDINDNYYVVMEKILAEAQKEMKDLRKFFPLNPVGGSGRTMYFDMGGFQNALNACMNNQTGKLDMKKLDQYLQSLFKKFRESGLTNVDLSFAQLSDVLQLLGGSGKASPTDVIAQLMKLYPGALQEYVKVAHANGVKVTLSFGGANGYGKNWKIQGDPVKYANELNDFVKKMGLNGVDFDIEDASFSKTNPAPIATKFFTTLHDLLAKEGKKSTLTIMGGLADWPKRYLKDLFQDGKGNSVFTKMFDGVNLMLYSSTQYYLDAKNPTWGIEEWLDLLGKQNASKIHIGFEDGINYANPKNSAGTKYHVDTTDSGKAAAEVYKQLLAQLEKDGYPSKLGSAFFWPDWSGEKYGTKVVDGKVVTTFPTDFEKSFDREMKS